MNNLYRFLLWPALLLVVCSTRVLRDQFQEPAKEELQMTSDPTAPGASAVYLNREEITDENSATTTYYARIKILTEQGKEMATECLSCAPESERIADIEGRTSSPAEGRPDWSRPRWGRILHTVDSLTLPIRA